MKIRTLLFIITLFFIPVVNFAQAPDLGMAANFVLFTTTGAVSNAGISVINNKIGTNNGAITGFTPIPEQEQNANTMTAQAAADLQVAYDEMYNAAQTRPTHAAILGNGETLYPGIYLIPEAASIVGDLILDAQGNPNAVFIFKIGGAFSPGPSSKILLTGSATPCNVFWAVEGGAIAIATTSEMKGTFIANPGAVSMAASGILEGRLLSTTGAITVDGVVASLPQCDFVLPLTLLNFSATRKNSLIELTWTIDNESSIIRYDLERAAEGRNFESIGSALSTGGTDIKNYTLNDNFPLAAINFYRLKMTGTDGAFKYSTILRINMDAGKKISIYPNPSSGHILFLQMYKQLKGEHLINICDINGKKIMSSKVIHDGNDAVISITLDRKLLPGLYYFQLTDPIKHTETLTLLVK